jgi:hypothetical protein
MRPRHCVTGDGVLDDDTGRLCTRLGKFALRGRNYRVGKTTVRRMLYVMSVCDQGTL